MPGLLTRLLFARRTVESAGFWLVLICA